LGSEPLEGEPAGLGNCRDGIPIPRGHQITWRQPGPADTGHVRHGGILATAIGPVVAAGLTAATGSWWPIAAMLVVYSVITLVSAVVAPETRGRDLVQLEDAV
jgi:hypothetical protein